MSTDPSFTIPARPERRFPSRGGVEYEGQTVFHLRPNADPGTADLEALVESVLADGPYRWGDFLELPMVVWLVRDDETGDVFRVSIRDGSVRVHVLPETESPGIRRFYELLAAGSDCEWWVECLTDLA